MPSSLFLEGRLVPGVTSGLSNAVPYIEHWASLGLGSNEIIRRSQSLGFKMQRQAALRVIKQIKNITQARGYIARVGNDRPLDPGRIPFSLTPIRRNYSYKVRITGEHTMSGERMTRYVTVTSDELLTKAGAVGIAESYLEEDATTYGLTNYSSVLVGIIKNAETLG